jgi:hypothetical protein
MCTKMGTPNDEVFRGHPLNGKGLRPYCPLLVKNSSWIKELEAINSVHSYIFGFHDSTFECVAESFLVEARATTLAGLLTEICGKLIR